MIRFPKRPDGASVYEEETGPWLAMALTRSHDTAALHALIDAHESWRAHKAAFAAAQHGKCGYCERVCTGSWGDVEHYRPKKAVHTLGRRGQELPDNRVRGRTRRKAESFEQGYWWLTWDWDNYLFVCEVCNRTWKRSFFPIQGGHHAPPAMGQEKTELALLLSPWDGPDPVEHLDFGPLGEVEAVVGSAWGRETIRTCGLDRERLRSAREEKAGITWKVVNLLLRLLLIEPLPRSALLETVGALLRLGDIQREHAGMVRSIVRQELALTWSGLEQLERRLRR